MGMTNLTLEVCIKEYLQDHNFYDLLQLVTDIYREIIKVREVEDGNI